MIDTSFRPQVDTVSVGTTVTWVNEDGVNHTVTADDGSFDSGTVGPDGTFQHSFGQAGTMPYHCEIHGQPDAGMHGTVVEVVAEPQLSLLAFRLAPDGREGPELDALNRRFLERINARQRVFLSATTLRGRYTLRICVLSFRTHRERMEQGLDDIRAAAGEAVGYA